MSLMKSPGRNALAMALALVLGGCASAEKLIDKFTGPDSGEVLQGARESVLVQDRPDLTQSASDQPVVIPAAVGNASWTQPGGVPSHALHNLALGPDLSRAFSVGAGEGSDSYGRLTASPIIVGGRVYVLDTRANVRAFSGADGSPVWARSLVPEGRDDEGAFGGGLASDGSHIYATTAFGEAVALDAASGAELWRRKFDVPIRGAPTVSEGKVFFVTISNEVHALSTSDGSTLWQFVGTGEQASVIASSSPAVASGFVVVPQTTGDLVAFREKDGIQAWSETLMSPDPTSSMANLNDIAGRPVIADGQVYAIAHSGRMGAFLLSSGEPVWNQEISGTQTPWVAGDYLFVMAGRDSVAAIERKTGAVRWTAKLPAGVWAGPVLGGGRLIAVSSTGTLANISPQTGQVLSTMELGDAFYIAPVIADGTVYLLADSGSLIALR